MNELHQIPNNGMFKEQKVTIQHIPRLRPNSEICSKRGETQ